MRKGKSFSGEGDDSQTTGFAFGRAGKQFEQGVEAGGV